MPQAVRSLREEVQKMGLGERFVFPNRERPARPGSLALIAAALERFLLPNSYTLMAVLSKIRQNSVRAPDARMSQVFSWTF
ncbi:unnamed protein product [Nippostrongylus brasiliensis]|uniref:Rho-GAP domain-containing protein n=1 Tax=Nippostrongylus brasiliensis TaxID=27835 RepID=A0A0N4Y8W0_NIPBR|nr:unnamed protein product [Nippostrongylus brasiliensis]